MAPVPTAMTPEGKVPHVVKRVRDQLAMEDIRKLKSWGDIKKLISPIDLNVLQTGMKQQMSDANKTAFKAAAKEKRADFVRFYLLDPKDAICRGFNEVVNTHAETDEPRGE